MIHSGNFALDPRNHTFQTELRINPHKTSCWTNRLVRKLFAMFSFYSFSLGFDSFFHLLTTLVATTRTSQRLLQILFHSNTDKR